MNDDSMAIVPVWTLATGDVHVPAVPVDGPMTAERLTELRGVLAALADQPIATLEVHPLADKVDLSGGIPLDAASPLAQHLSQLITQSARTVPVAATANAAGESLHRMVLPAKVAAQFGQGTVRLMPSKAVAGGGARRWIFRSRVTAEPCIELAHRPCQDRESWRTPPFYGCRNR